MRSLALTEIIRVDEFLEASIFYGQSVCSGRNRRENEDAFSIGHGLAGRARPLIDIYQSNFCVRDDCGLRILNSSCNCAELVWASAVAAPSTKPATSGTARRADFMVVAFPRLPSFRKLPSNTSNNLVETKP